MAILIPPYCDVTTRPTSEVIVFDKISEKLSNDWIVFHSFDYHLKDIHEKPYYKDGEIDFLIYHPSHGILTLEVKGGEISYRDNQWYQKSRNRSDTHVIDPFQQARDNKHAVIHLLKAKLKQSYLPIKFAHAVCFPSCNTHALGPAESQGCILFGDMLNEIQTFIISIFQTSPEYNSSDRPQISPEKIIKLLSPTFTYPRALKLRIQEEKKRFESLTQQQLAILDALRNFKRLHFLGCSGSGKTHMAVSKAKQLANEGKSVLLLCYNVLLSNELKKQVRGFRNIEAVAFFEWSLKTIGATENDVSKYRKESLLYLEILPRFLTKHIKQCQLLYDAIIVDEAQDFESKAWDAIQLLLHSESVFYIFYDPDQNIFTKRLNIPTFETPPVMLSQNCRNTQHICETLQNYQSVPSKTIDTAPIGAAVEYRHGRTVEHLQEELERLILTEKIPPHDIVILGSHNYKNTPFNAVPYVGKWRIVEGPTHAKQELNYYTFMKFKGCEAPVVILFDVDTSEKRWNEKGLYTAMSRAVSQLIVLYH